MKRYYVTVIQIFEAHANDELDAKRMVEDIMRSGGMSTEQHYIVGTNYYTNKELRKDEF